MGVPAFYRWLSEKYPKIVQDVAEERVLTCGDSTIRLPFDSTRPNPSGLECDNLYIDMNGIIHPCSHPEVGPQPQTEEDMYENVCRYVDRLFRAMRPRQLLFLAIDGVAPRAKMNQQRARRFRSAQEARELAELETHVLSELADAGKEVPTVISSGSDKNKPWDSNVITPGTPFMRDLADYVRFYIRKRISTDAAWKQIRVIFSDASIPGEGEHKIMSHVRLQRAQPGYNPNQVHVLHGLDADLIMLALATHEAHFYISREEVTFGRKSLEAQERRQNESGFTEQQRALDEAAGTLAMQSLPENQGKPFQRISIPLLRQYIANEFDCCLRLPFSNLERLIDDIVFMCFFVGNDFLPHLPSLDIRSGGLDYLFNVYKRLLPSMGDYITKSGGNVNLSHVDVILSEVGAIEDYVFSMKHDSEQRDAERRKKFRRNGNNNNNKPKADMVAQLNHAKRGKSAKILEKSDDLANARALKSSAKSHGQIKVKHMERQQNAAAAEALKASLSGGGDPIIKEDPNAAVKEEQTDSQVVKEEPDTEKIKREPDEQIKREPDGMQTIESNEPDCSSKRKRPDEVKIKEDPGVVGDIEDEFDKDEDDNDDDKMVGPDALKVENAIVPVNPQVLKDFKERIKKEQEKKLDEYASSVVDKVRLHESGWKDRYYSDKCKADDVAAHGGREHLFRSYVMGLIWVMKYYYEGCPSWKWYYPFHYGPFASDLKNIERFEKDCRSFELATPFNPVEQLMAVLPSDSSHAIPVASRWLMTDKESPILDFYPIEVPVDPNGKAMPWLWVVLLPFIEEERLLDAMGPSMKDWTKEELLCNARGMDDGYVYVHRTNPLSKKFAKVLADGKSANSSKVPLTDAAQYGCAGFSGSLRPPLSNEVFPIDEDVEIPPPPTSTRLTESIDGLLSESLTVNDAVCVAFSEPQRLSHKSILLPGAVLLPPCLTAEDKQIRRPKLNRGGGTIANLGTSNGRSQQSGYGSMNISNYERELAQRNGRGHQMNQTGMRAWGAMEPQQKRRRDNFPPPPPPPQMSNPLMHHQQQGHYQGGVYQQQQQHGYHHQGHNQQGHQHQAYQQNGGGYHHQQNGHGGYNHNYQQQQQQHHGRHHQHPNQHHGHHRGGYNGGGRGAGYHGRGAGYPGRGGPPQHSQRQGFDFRSQSQQGPPQGGGQQQQQQTRTSSAVMNSLRAQLSNTLQRGKKS